MYRLTAYGKTRMPLSYVPWQDMSDAEFAQFGRPLLLARGYFEYVPDEPTETEAPEAQPSAPAPSVPDDDAASPAEVLGGRSKRR